MRRKLACLGIVSMVLSLFAAASGMGTTAHSEEIPMIEPMDIKKLRITVIYDNFGGNEGLRADWGFSCLIEGPEKSILFDTGLDPAIFSNNMKLLKISPEQVDLMVLSHEHGDHIGGLPAFFRMRTDLPVWVPSSFSDPVKAYIRQSGAAMEEVDDAPRRICRQAATLGKMSSGLYWPEEQVLYIATHQGGIVVTGCAHPGIVKIVERAKSVMGPEILLVMGGFHLATLGEAAIRRIVDDFKRLEVRHAAPCHCSGVLARKCFREAYGARYIDIGVGTVITGADFKPASP
jgi:7,8-dihydropterin-6-yl-methyl-4-(beta-D-ribofuranosyl)aminobenzene 5'-phosphate synthase